VFAYGRARLEFAFAILNMAALGRWLSRAGRAVW